MNRVVGIVLCVFSLVGLVSSPALAAISCAMKCQNTQPAIEVSSVSKASTDAMAYHCAEMAKAAEAALQLNSAETDSAEQSLIADELVVFDGNLAAGDFGCDCPASCALTVPAVLANAELPAIQQQTGDISVFKLRSVEKSLPGQPYRPPIA